MNKIQNSHNSLTNVKNLEAQQVLSDAENIIQQFNEPKKQHKINLFVLLPILIIVLLGLFFSTIFSIVNINNSNIVNGIFIQGIDVSGLSKEQAKEKVSKIINEHLSKNISMYHGDYSTSISPSQFNVSFDIDTAVNTAYSIGRSDNIFKNNYAIVNALSTNINIGPSISYDTNLLNSIISNINTELPDKIIEPNYYIEDTTLIISNGKDGTVIDSSSLISEILFMLSNISDNVPSIDIPVNNKQSETIDIDSIYNAVHKNPVDAYYSTNPYVVYPSSNGIDFKISLEDAKAMLATPKDEYDIPLKIIYPNVTTNQIGTEAFPDLLSEFSTSFSTSNYNRATNIILAANRINGVVLMPGETFSYNQTVGKRTVEAGFKEAAAYSNGEVVQEVGGGICQVSSTLYNAVLYSNLEITERTNHCFKPSYVKPGLDATVSWGGPDFKFTNNRTYPIKLIVDSSNRKLHFYIYGLKTNTDYSVVLEANYVSTVYAKTVYKTDSSLSSGEKRVIQNGSNGCNTATYKILYDVAGNYVSKSLVSEDTYNAHNKIIAIGK